MSLTSVHPQYSLFQTTWKLMRDSFGGEKIIKDEGFVYLPPTSGMLLDGAATDPNSVGFKTYDAYRKRAVYHAFVEQAVKIALGKLHHKPSVIELPTALEPLRDRATVNGDSLEVLHMKINKEQLTTGRLGLLLDLPITPGVQDLPYIATYGAEHIRNWDDGEVEEPVLQTLNLVVLDESEFVRGQSSSSGSVGQFEWVLETKYRVLVLGDVAENEGQNAGVYRSGLFVGIQTQFSEEALTAPQIRGQTLDKIPFVFINPMDTLTDVDKPPLDTIARLALTIYRGEADYRQSLFMQGQDTLVMIGVADDGKGATRVGAGAEIRIPSPEGDAKYIGVDSMGLPEQRSAIENDMERAEQLSGQFISKTSQVESGDAVRRRMTAQAVTLTDVAKAGAMGLERILKCAAEWVGANPDEVSVQPNLDFEDDELLPSELAAWMGAANMGAPISRRTIWENIKRRELTNEETFEDEMAQIESEQVFRDDADIPGGGGVDDDEDEDENDDENGGEEDE